MTSVPQNCSILSGSISYSNKEYFVSLLTLSSLFRPLLLQQCYISVTVNSILIVGISLNDIHTTKCDHFICQL